MSVCVCVCVYVCMSVCTQTHTHTHMYRGRAMSRWGAGELHKSLTSALPRTSLSIMTPDRQAALLDLMGVNLSHAAFTFPQHLLVRQAFVF